MDFDYSRDLSVRYVSEKKEKEQVKEEIAKEVNEENVVVPEIKEVDANANDVNAIYNKALVEGADKTTETRGGGDGFFNDGNIQQVYNHYLIAKQSYIMSCQNMTSVQKSYKLAELDLRIKGLNEITDGGSMFTMLFDMHISASLANEIHATISEDLHRWRAEALSLQDVGGSDIANKLFIYNKCKLRYEHSNALAAEGRVDMLNNLLNQLSSFFTWNYENLPDDVKNYIESEYKTVSQQRDVIFSNMANSAAGSSSIDMQQHFLGMLSNYQNEDLAFIFAHNTSVQNLHFFREKISTYQNILSALHHMLSMIPPLFGNHGEIIAQIHRFEALLASAQNYYDQSNPIVKYSIAQEQQNER